MCSLRICIPLTLVSRPLNVTTSNTLIVPWDHPVWCGRGIETTHKDSVTEASTWTKGGVLISFWGQTCCGVCDIISSRTVELEGWEADLGEAMLDKTCWSLHSFISPLWIFHFPPCEHPSAPLSLSFCSLHSFLHLSSLTLPYLLKIRWSLCLALLHCSYASSFPFGEINQWNQLLQCLVATLLGHDGTLLKIHLGKHKMLQIGKIKRTI